MFFFVQLNSLLVDMYIASLMGKEEISKTIFKKTII